MEDITTINEFKGEFWFLSNFYPSPITMDEITYPTAEHAFQAGKTADMALRKQIAVEPTPGRAKRAGRRLPIVQNWDEIRLDHMRLVVSLKFDQHQDLLVLLRETGKRSLVEGNNWGDTFWGQVNGRGENWLGRILMDERRWAIPEVVKFSVESMRQIADMIENPPEPTEALRRLFRDE